MKRCFSFFLRGTLGIAGYNEKNMVSDIKEVHIRILKN